MARPEVVPSYSTPVSTWYTLSESSLILRDDSGEDWFSNEEKLQRVHSCVAQVRKLGRRIKIAILDSGIDSSHTEIAQNIVQPWPDHCTSETKAKIKAENDCRAIKKWQGFPHTLDPRQDALGHGTHIASVILKTAPYAALYIARIFNDHGQMCELDELEKVQIRAIYVDIDLQAFEWAIEENVALLSLSWGFRTETVPEIKRVINKAIESGIIVIAAAGNQGSLFEIPFPANMPDVFCIGAARALGHGSEFNPPHDKDFKFSALGEQVLAAYAKHDRNSASLHNEQQARSGSSIAVAVAVGIAANVLEYVTGVLDGRFEGRDATVAMKKLFIAMSSATRKNDYKNLVPWDLFRSDMAANNQRIDEILKSEIGIVQLMTILILYLDSIARGFNFILR